MWSNILRAISLLVVAQALAAAPTVQMSVVDLGKLDTGRPAIVHLWYPAGTCATTETEWCLAESAVTHKVVVFSPGSMGTATEYAWIAEGLAAAGFIVVGVNPFGESRVYDRNTRDVTSTGRTWQRPQDVARILDQLPQQSRFQRAVQWDRVVAIGHSAGGQTSALLAGARFDLRQVANYCASSESQGDVSCQYAASGSSAPESWVKLFNGSYQDTRIRKIVLLDPALGSALKLESGAGIHLPTLIVGATQNDFLPWKSHGARYAAAIPGASTLELAQGEGHFIFLSPCTHDAAALGVPLCRDRVGVDRRAVQANVLRRVVEFVRVDDEPAEVARHRDATQSVVNMNIPQNRWLQIVYFTPRWVFVLLAVLCFYGWWQSRPRRATIAAASILPVSMLIWSATSMLGYVDNILLAIVLWLLGCAVIAALRLKLQRTPPATLDASTGQLLIAGSWWPLVVILGIFFTRYALGAADALRANIMEQPAFQALIALTLGAWSGYFAAQSLAMFRARATVGAAPP